uniref:UDENN domain-containing protein n=1 Tax=Spongospora subterranea TaxID=70186 RepID=A0A0H5QR27_9EUKA|eukprot:CRZ03926.1 hypothetical protein [Spongospora subterranea]
MSRQTHDLKQGQVVSPVSMQSPTSLNVFPISSSIQARRKSWTSSSPLSRICIEYILLMKLGPPATLIDRYPVEDRESFACPDVTLISDMCSSPKKLPRCCFSFFLSNSCTYGTSYIFQDPESSDSQNALVIISRFGFCSSFQSIAIDLFDRMGPSCSPFSQATLSYVAFLCDKVPAPQPGGSALRVLSPHNDLHWRLYLPDSQCRFELPLLDLSVIFLLKIMDISTILLAISSILTGKSLVIHSGQLSLLLPICECLLSLIFPFKWTNVYVPVLPSGILQVLDSPVPFIVGTLTSNLKSVQLGAHCVVVDVDMSNVTSESSLVLLPAQPTKLLCRQVRRVLFQSSLFDADARSIIQAETASSDEHQPNVLLREINVKQERDIRFCFIRYICSLLHDYRRYLRFDNSNDTHFDSATFLEKRMDARPFLSRFIQTQMFTEFLELHVETPSLLDDFLFYSTLCDSPVGIPVADQEISIESPVVCRFDDAQIALTSLYYKDMRECSRPVHQSRMYLLVCDLIRTDDPATHDPINAADLYSTAELLCFAHWRALFIDTVMAAVHADSKSASISSSQPAVQLPLERYTALAFLFGRGLDEAALAPHDYGYARKCILDAALQIAGKLPKTPDQSKKPSLIFLKDSIKHCSVWQEQTFWEYYLSLNVLQNTMGKDCLQASLYGSPKAYKEVKLKSRAESVPQSMEHFVPIQKRGRSVAEEDFIFGEMCSLLCLLQSLELSRNTASQIILNLSRLWHFDQAQISDLITLINNMYRAQPEESSSPFRASARHDDMFGVRTVQSPIRSMTAVPLSPTQQVPKRSIQRSQSF